MKARIWFMLSFAMDSKKNIQEKQVSSERAIKIYRQHIRQPQYQQLTVEEHLRTCGDRKFHMFPFFKNIQENKVAKKIL